MMVRGIVDSKELDDLHEKCLLRYNIPLPKTQNEKSISLADFLRVVNKQLKHAHLKLTRTKDDESRYFKAYLILVNRNKIPGGREKCPMLTFKQNELDYWQILVKKIMHNEMKQILHISALNCVSEMNPKLAKKVNQLEWAQNTLEKFKEHKWLRFDNVNPKVRLAPRFVKEMEPYLREDFEKYVADCSVCHNIVIQVIFVLAKKVQERISAITTLLL